MTLHDAVRLLLAVADSQFVKDSKATLDNFHKLPPLRRGAKADRRIARRLWNIIWSGRRNV